MDVVLCSSSAELLLLLMVVDFGCFGSSNLLVIVGDAVMPRMLLLNLLLL